MSKLDVILKKMGACENSRSVLEDLSFEEALKKANRADLRWLARETASVWSTKQLSQLRFSGCGFCAISGKEKTASNREKRAHIGCSSNQGKLLRKWGVKAVAALIYKRYPSLKKPATKKSAKKKSAKKRASRG